MMDKGQIQQVLTNLVVNSQEAMPMGGNILINCCNVVIDEYCTESCEDQSKLTELSKGVYVKVTIRDFGCGISEQIKEKIFDPFFSTKGGSRGLGLAIVYSIIRKHGATIVIDEPVKNGASLSIYLPAIEESTPEQITGRKVINNPEDEHQYGHLLLMDDEEIIRKTTSAILKHIGYTVVTAVSGEDALRIFNEAISDDNPFDLAILDLTVAGGMGGKECVAQLKTIDSELKIIVSSGYSNDDVLANYSKYGFDGMIQKPYVVDELLDQIQNVLYPL
jgi:CheY-like chemotaxis protein